MLASFRHAYSLHIMGLWDVKSLLFLVSFFMSTASLNLELFRRKTSTFWKISASAQRQAEEEKPGNLTSLQTNTRHTLSSVRPPCKRSFLFLICPSTGGVVAAARNFEQYLKYGVKSLALPTTSGFPYEQTEHFFVIKISKPSRG